MSSGTGHDDGDGARGHGPGLALAWIALAGFGLAVGCESAVPGGQARVDADRGDADMAADADMEPVDMQPVDMALPCNDAEVGSPCSVGQGACLVWGTLACGEDGLMFCDAEAGQPGDEVCNGEDDDCDGEADEKLTQVCYGGPEGTEGAGICRVGMRSCVDGMFGACEGAVLPEAGDRCDGRDEDCDGEVDEDERMVACYAGPAGTEGVGACRGGTRTCTGGALGACEGEVLPAAVDVCDGRDEDCDGEVDEDEQMVACYAGPPGTDGVGTCRAGTRTCTDGALGACAGEVLPEAIDRCDGRNEDCDGEVDEDEQTVACYTGPAGTEGVGICRAGTRTCTGGMLGDCVGEVLPEAVDVCDGRDEDCDGQTDIGPGGEPVCGEVVARYCRFWLGLSSDAIFNPTRDPERPYSDVFREWGDCPLRDEDPDGATRCTSSRGGELFRPMEFPAGLVVGADHTFGVRFYCDFVGAPPELIQLLGDIRLGCHISLGTGAFDQGPEDGSPSWGVCESVEDRGVSEDGFLHCNSSPAGPAAGSWAPVSVGPPLGARTDLGLAFRCRDDELGRSVQRQTALWLGWTAWSADGPPVGAWGRCPDEENPSGDGPRCVSSRGDGLYHRLDVGASVGPGGTRHAGWLGVAITPVDPAPRAREGVAP